MKQFIKAISLLFLLVVGSTALDSCQKIAADGVLSPDVVDSVRKIVMQVLTARKRDSLDSLINLMGLLPTIPTVPQTPVGPPTPEFGNPDTIYCQLQKMKWAAGDENALLLDPTPEVIFPGSLIESYSVTDGSYRPIIFPRRPMLISTSLTNISGSTKETILDPSKKSSAQDAVNLLLQRTINGKIPAKMTKDIEKVYAMEQASLAVGARFNGWGAKVAAKFNWSDKKIKQRFIVKFYQEFCNISTDLPAKPSCIFDSLPPVRILGSYSPVFVSNVKYGRVVLFLWETESDDEQIEASLNASYSTLAAGGGITSNAKFREIMQKSKMQVLAFGGDPAMAARINSPETMQEFIVNSAEFTPTSQGVMIGYTLRFLKDNSVAKIVKATEYTVRTCEVVPETPYEFPSPNAYDFGVNLINGDGEFDGHGPIVHVSVQLRIVDNKEVWMKVWATFDETKDNWTKGLVDRDVKLFSVPDGYTLLKIISKNETTHDYTSNNKQLTSFEKGNSELVRTFMIRGDTDGDDLPSTSFSQNRTWLRFYLNKIVVSMRKQR